MGFVMSRRGAFGIGFRNADSAGAAEALLDAQQYKRVAQTPFIEASLPTEPIAGTIVAVRKGFAAIDLPNGETCAVPVTSLDAEAPAFGQSVTFTPPGNALEQGATNARPSQARSRR
jgi:hypothetical protein